MKIEDTWTQRAQWITHSLPEEEEACPIFGKTIRMEELTGAGPVKRAVAIASALGIYELSIDGRKVGDAFFAPRVDGVQQGETAVSDLRGDRYAL